MRAKTSSRPRARQQTRKEEIRRIAAELFARNGYHATGITELSEAVGLGRGALYHHIGSKEALLFDICSGHVFEMVKFGEELLELDISPVEKFRRLSRRLMRTIADELPELTVFFSEIRSLTGERAAEVVRIRRQFESIWLAIVQEGVERGMFRSADPLIIKGLLGLHNYAYLWIDPEGDRTPEEISDLFCDLALRGLLTNDARESGVV